jgi:hypothetical protein
MGGSAFKNIDVRRIKLEEIHDTLDYFQSTVSYPGFNLKYIEDNLLGSVGKQPDSGDIDIAIDDYKFPWKSFKSHALLSFPERQRAGNGKNTLQVNFAVPIMGDPLNGFCQIDLITGNPEWLKFTHYSPGAASKYKGVYMSTLLGVMAKMDIGYLAGEDSINAIAKVTWAYDLERGLRRRWMIQDYRDIYCEVDADRWESQLGYLMDRGVIPKGPTPRFSRVGYITDPERVVDLLFKGKLTKDELTDFEIGFKVALEIYKGQEDQLATRLIEALQRSGLKSNKTATEIEESVRALL